MEGRDSDIPRLDLTVLMGGPSAEREVSLWSGTAVADALESVGHKVTRSDISPTNASALDREGIDAVFIAMHGAFGESGEVQQLCENRNLPYVGSEPRPSRLCMNKAATKQFLRQANLPTPDWMIIESFHAPATYQPWLAELPVPVVVKPVDGGSSVDVTIARDESTRDEKIGELIEIYGRVMLERFVEGREMTVGILDDQALPICEILPDGAFYDYRAKYSDDAATRYIFDHGLDASTTETMQSMALAAHRCLGCRDMSRVDFILDPQNQPHILEINTIPGFTSHSLLPKAAAEAGVDFAGLCDRLVQLAWARAARP
ncbi:MAG: D-alanine--D-alanine ligase [Phycisphaerae bacterium]